MDKKDWERLHELSPCNSCEDIVETALHYYLNCLEDEARESTLWHDKVLTRHGK